MKMNVTERKSTILIDSRNMSKILCAPIELVESGLLDTGWEKISEYTFKKVTQHNHEHVQSL